MARQILIIIRPPAGDDDGLPRPQVPQGLLDGQADAAVAQHQSLFSSDGKIPGHIAKAVVIRIIAIPAVGAAHQGIDAADARRCRRQGLAIRDHRFFIRDRDVHPG